MPKIEVLRPVLNCDLLAGGFGVMNFAPFASQVGLCFEAARAQTAWILGACTMACPRPDSGIS